MMYKRVDELEPGDRLAQSLRHPKSGTTLITPHYVLDSRSLPQIRASLRGAGHESVLVYNPALAILERYYEEERQEARSVLFRTLVEKSSDTDGLLISNRSIAEFSKAIGTLCTSIRNSKLATSFIDAWVSGTDEMATWRTRSAERCYLALTLGLEVREKALEDINASLQDVGTPMITDLCYEDLGLGAMFIDVQEVFGDDETLALLNELENRPLARAVIRQRSQRFDGYGSPSHLPGNPTQIVLRGRAIHPYTRIAQIATCYSGMHIGSPPPRKKGPSADARIPARCLWEMSTQEDVQDAFDPDYLGAFLRIMQPYPIGHRVTLDTGETGVVIEFLREAPWRPTVRVLGQGGRTLPDPYDVKLLDRPEVAIARYEDSSEDCLAFRPEPRGPVSSA